MDEFIATLRRENYCLMTDEDGLEIHDDQGNLLVCKSKSKMPHIKSHFKIGCFRLLKIFCFMSSTTTKTRHMFYQ